MNKFTLGAIPSPTDTRDWKYENIFKLTVSKSKILDYRSQLLPIRNQGSQGSCVAMTGASIKETQEKLDSDINEYFSPQYIYNQRSNKTTDGMFIRDLLKILQEKGCSLEVEYPYLSKDVITPELITKSKRFNISNYSVIDTVEGLKDSLEMNGPSCLIALPVYNFGSRMWHKSEETDKIIGYHCMRIVGYDDDKQSFIIRNSWGSNWGDKGYTYFPYTDWAEKSEVWTIIDSRNGKVTLQEKIKLLWYNFKLWVSKNKMQLLVFGPMLILLISAIIYNIIQYNK